MAVLHTQNCTTLTLPQLPFKRPHGNRIHPVRGYSSTACSESGGVTIAVTNGTDQGLSCSHSVLFTTLWERVTISVRDPAKREMEEWLWACQVWRLSPPSAWRGKVGGRQHCGPADGSAPAAPRCPPARRSRAVSTQPLSLPTLGDRRRLLLAQPTQSQRVQGPGATCMGVRLQARSGWIGGAEASQDCDHPVFTEGDTGAEQSHVPCLSSLAQEATGPGWRPGSGLTARHTCWEAVGLSH